MADDQQQLEGTDYAKVRFVGMTCELPDLPKLGAEITFKVTGRVVLVGEELLDEETREVVKVSAISVVPT